MKTLLSRSTIDPFLLSAIAITFPLWTVYWIVTHWHWQFILPMLLISWSMGINTSMFAHRSWTHKSWTAVGPLNFIGLAFFTLSLIGNSLGWVAIHREHHRFTDTKDDPHSPFFMSRWRIQFYNYYTTVKARYIVDLAKDKLHFWFYRYYWHTNILFLLAIFFISQEFFALWIAAVGLSVFKTHTINTFGHDTPKFMLPLKGTTATNSLVLFVLNINNGEAWHLNHHDDASSYRFGTKWYQLDPSARLIEMFAGVKLANIRKNN